MKFVERVMGMKWPVDAVQGVACCQPKGTREEEISEWELPGLFLWVSMKNTIHLF